MHKLMMVALGAVAMSLAMPAAAQDIPLKGGDYWTVADVMIDDGHGADYADYLAGQYRKQMDWQISKGYIKSYKILNNVHKRAGEADLYLVTVFDHMPTNAESEARNAAANAYMATTDRAMEAGSGERAKYRHLGSSMLLQENVWRR
ncbi:hypothetical protein [Sphingomonas sp.]|uniref:hypothetical protein n=1 Tax=Sphingomonas sp. TaxID=28214 RepID=UPI00375195DE